MATIPPAQRDPTPLHLTRSKWSSLALTVQEVSPQAGGVEGGGPPLVGLGAPLTLIAFLVVMLIVPWIMARKPSDGEPARAESSFRASSGSLFSSTRERHLWLWTLAVLLAIYSTLWPVAELAAALRERNLLRISSAAALLIVVAAMAVPWARRRPGRTEIGAAIGITAVYLTTLIRIPVPEARSHLFEYGLVAILVYHALTERRRNGGRIPVPALIAVVATALLGWLDEGFQALIPNRAYDVVDVAFNAIAALMAITATLFMAWARRWDVLKRVRRRGQPTG